MIKRSIIGQLLFFSFMISSEPLLLIKIPTRSRPHQFFKNLDKFYQKLSFTIPYKFLISCDVDDASMNNATIIKRLSTYPNLEFSFNENKSKVEAFNRDLDKYNFDILLVAHDDMEPLVKGFDKIIVDKMKESFPDYDGVLNFNDGFVNCRCNILPVLGNKFYKRFGYVYNPEYKALVCNVELTLVSRILKKEKTINQVIIRHNHPAWGVAPKDDIYDKNEKYHKQDREIFNKRRAQLFWLSEEEISKVTPKLWSILICTIEEREESFNKLCQKLKDQSKKLSIEHQVEILAFKDKKGEHTIGEKRNILLQESQGKYVSFVDDDDDVHDEFIKLVYEKLQKKPDCVSFTGLMTTNGTNPRKFIHSARYKYFFEHNGVYFRPPNHLNPKKRAIAIQFQFPEKNLGEDTDWAMEIARTDLLKIEEQIDTPYYFYLYKDNK